MQQNRFIVYSFYSAFWILGISATLLGVNSENLTSQFDIENGGVFIALQGLGSTVTMLVFGLAYSYYPPRILLVSGPFLLGLGCGMIGLADTQLIAILGAVLLGLGFGALLMGPSIIIPAINKGKSTGALNALNMFFGIGAVTGPQIVNLAMRLNDYRLSFLFCALGAFVVTGIFSVMPLPNNINEGESPVGSLRTVWANIAWVTIMPFSILLLLYVGAEVGFGAWIYTQMTKVAGVDEGVATLIVSLFWGGVVIGRLLATYLVARIRAEQLLLLTIITIGIATAILLSFADSAIIGGICAFIIGVGCGPVFPTTLGIVSDTYPHLYAISSGIIIAIGNVGAMIIPWVQGQIGQGNNGGMIVTLLVSVIMIGIVIYIQRQIYQNNLATTAS